MNATDLCIVIDNDCAILRRWLERAGTTPWNAEAAEMLAEQVLRDAVGNPSGGTLWYAKSMALLALRDMGPTDWELVADHYRTKVIEGASVSEGDA